MGADSRRKGAGPETEDTSEKRGGPHGREPHRRVAPTWQTIHRPPRSQPDQSGADAPTDVPESDGLDKRTALASTRGPVADTSAWDQEEVPSGSEESGVLMS
jgi:hypothetical protein